MFAHGLSRTRNATSRRVGSTTRHIESLERRDLLTAELVRDIHIGRNDGDLSAHISPVVTYNGAGYFVESALGRGTNLFRTDGTESGTALVKQLSPDVLDVRFKSAVANGQLFFTAPSSSSQLLWRTNGLASGTQALAVMGDGDLFAFNDRLYFNGFSDTTGAELWVSDGSPVGTQLVADLTTGFGSSFLHNFAAVGTYVAFTNFNGNYEAPYAVNTTNSVVRSLGPYLHLDSPFVQVGSSLLFGGSFNGQQGQLWRTNGTAEGTAAFMDAIPNQPELATVLAVSGGTAIVSSWGGDTSVISRVDGDGFTQLLSQVSPLVRSTTIENGQLLVAFTNGSQTGMWQLDINQPTTVSRPIDVSPAFMPSLQEATFWNNSWYFPAIDSIESNNSDMWRVDLDSPATLVAEQTARWFQLRYSS